MGLWATLVPKIPPEVHPTSHLAALSRPEFEVWWLLLGCWGHVEAGDADSCHRCAGCVSKPSSSSQSSRSSGSRTTTSLHPPPPWSSTPTAACETPALPCLGVLLHPFLLRYCMLARWERTPSLLESRAPRGAGASPNPPQHRTTSRASASRSTCRPPRLTTPRAATSASTTSPWAYTPFFHFLVHNHPLDGAPDLL